MAATSEAATICIEVSDPPPAFLPKRCPGFSIASSAASILWAF